MKRLSRVIATAAVALSLAAGLSAAQAQSSSTRNVGTHVYLLRGFMDIFSTGMDDLGVKLNRRGIRASVHGHAEYPTLVDDISDRYRRGIRENVVIIGHSLGANAAFSMAEDLGKRGISVPLIIAYDPTSPMTASANVARVVNFYSSTNGWGVAIGRGAGFRGSLSNVDLSRRGEMGHTDIDKSPALHAQSIGFIQSIGGGGNSRTSAAAPKSDATEKTNGAKPESKDDSKPGSDAAAKPAAGRTETAASPSAPSAPASN
ncbi:MAG: lipase [Bradyrhizobiaceae bacterium]|nr:lipase [Bradyrhizobiaceae bacterium]